MIFEAKYKAVKRKIKSDDFFYTIKIIIDRIMRLFFYRKSSLYYVDILDYLLKPEKIWPTINAKLITDFSDLSPKDIETIRNYTGSNYITEMEMRFNNNWRLFLAFIDSQIAGAIWGISNDTEFKTKVIPLFDGDVALIDNWTIPEHRGKGVHPFLLSYAACCYKNEGFKRAFGSVNKKNIASMKGFIKADFHHYINYKSYKIFSKEIVIWEPK